MQGNNNLIGFDTGPFEIFKISIILTLAIGLSSLVIFLLSDCFKLLSSSSLQIDKYLLDEVFRIINIGFEKGQNALYFRPKFRSRSTIFFYLKFGVFFLVIIALLLTTIFSNLGHFIRDPICFVGTSMWPCLLQDPFSLFSSHIRYAFRTYNVLVTIPLVFFLGVGCLPLAPALIAERVISFFIGNETIFAIIIKVFVKIAFGWLFFSSLFWYLWTILINFEFYWLIDNLFQSDDCQVCFLSHNETSNLQNIDRTRYARKEDLEEFSKFNYRDTGLFHFTEYLNFLSDNPSDNSFEETIIANRKNNWQWYTSGGSKNNSQQLVRHLYKIASIAKNIHRGNFRINNFVSSRVQSIEGQLQFLNMAVIRHNQLVIKELSKILPSDNYFDWQNILEQWNTLDHRIDAITDIRLIDWDAINMSTLVPIPGIFIRKNDSIEFFITASKKELQEETLKIILNSRFNNQPVFDLLTDRDNLRKEFTNFFNQINNAIKYLDISTRANRIPSAKGLIFSKLISDRNLLEDQDFEGIENIGLLEQLPPVLAPEINNQQLAPANQQAHQAQANNQPNNQAPAPANQLNREIEGRNIERYYELFLRRKSINFTSSSNLVNNDIENWPDVRTTARWSNLEKLLTPVILNQYFTKVLTWYFWSVSQRVITHIEGWMNTPQPPGEPTTISSIIQNITLDMADKDLEEKINKLVIGHNKMDQRLFEEFSNKIKMLLYNSFNRVIENSQEPIDTNSPLFRRALLREIQARVVKIVDQVLRNMEQRPQKLVEEIFNLALNYFIFCFNKWATETNHLPPVYSFNDIVLENPANLDLEIIRDNNWHPECYNQLINAQNQFLSQINNSYQDPLEEDSLANIFLLDNTRRIINHLKKIQFSHLIDHDRSDQFSKRQLVENSIRQNRDIEARILIKINQVTKVVYKRIFNLFKKPGRTLEVLEIIPKLLVTCNKRALDLLFSDNELFDKCFSDHRGNLYEFWDLFKTYHQEPFYNLPEPDLVNIIFFSSLFKRTKTLENKTLPALLEQFDLFNRFFYFESLNNQLESLRQYLTNSFLKLLVSPRRFNFISSVSNFFYRDFRQQDRNDLLRNFTKNPIKVLNYCFLRWLVIPFDFIQNFSLANSISQNFSQKANLALELKDQWKSNHPGEEPGNLLGLGFDILDYLFWPFKRPKFILEDCPALGNIISPDQIRSKICLNKIDLLQWNQAGQVMANGLMAKRNIIQFGLMKIISDNFKLKQK